MKIKTFKSFFLILIIISLIFTSCDNKFNNKSGDTHEPLTIITAKRDYTEFAEAFKKAYPEVKLKFISYSGENASTYLQKILETGQAPDIYTTNILPDKNTQKKYLVDLSVYDFSARYAVSQLNECSVDGAIYTLPSNYNVIGIYYNKTLFKKHGWTVPVSFEELQELAPKIEAAGVDLACTALEKNGVAFQYLFNLGDTVFLRKPDGIEWIEQFLSGKTDADAVWEETLDYVQKWIDLGMIDKEWLGRDNDEAREYFAQGNTAFFVQGGTFRFTQNEDGTGDQYGLMPWLSEDGSNNRYITMTFCYYGLNANLENPKNRQKLQDALKFMEFISSEEGQRLLPGGASQLLPLSVNWTDGNNEYEEVIKTLNAGYNAPLTYAGWEDIIVPVGNECLKWYAGESTGKRVIAVMNQALKDSLENMTYTCVEIAENLTMEETAKLVGASFAEAAGADCSLISLGEYHDGKENQYGVNGCLWLGSATDEIICTVNPLGWVDTIKTFTLSGKEIKELAEKGFDLFGDGNTFPYVMVKKAGVELKDNSKYSVVIAGYTENIKEKGNIRDTGICGMDAIREYLSKLGTVTKESVNWD